MLNALTIRTTWGSTIIGVAWMAMAELVLTSCPKRASATCVRKVSACVVPIGINAEDLRIHTCQDQVGFGTNVMR